MGANQSKKPSKFGKRFSPSLPSVSSVSSVSSDSTVSARHSGHPGHSGHSGHSAPPDSSPPPCLDSFTTEGLPTRKRKSPEFQKNDDEEECFERGVSLARIGNSTKAIEFFSYIIETNIQETKTPRRANSMASALPTPPEVAYLVRRKSSISAAKRLLSSLLWRSDVYAEIGELEKSYLDAVAAVEMFPHSHVANLQKGIVLLLQKEYARAVQEFSQSWKKNKSDPIVMQYRSHARSLVGDTEGAIEDIGHAIALLEALPASLHKRKMTTFLMIRAELHLELKHGQLALDDANRVLGMMKKHDGTTKDKDAGDSGDAGDAGVGKPSDTSEVSDEEDDLSTIERCYVLRGLSYVQLNQHRRAIPEFSAALHIRETDYLALRSRGFSCFEVGEYESAIRDLTQCIYVLKQKPKEWEIESLMPEKHAESSVRRFSFDPSQRDLYDCLYCRGLAFQSIENHARSLLDLNVVVEECPSIVEGIFRRGLVRLDMGCVEDALKDMDSYCGMFDDAPITEQIHCRMDCAVELMEEKRYLDAIRFITEVLQLDVRNTPALVLRAMAFFHAGDLLRAAVDVKKAALIDPIHNELVKKLRRKIIGGGGYHTWSLDQMYAWVYLVADAPLDQLRRILLTIEEGDIDAVELFERMNDVRWRSVGGMDEDWKLLNRICTMFHRRKQTVSTTRLAYQLGRNQQIDPSGHRKSDGDFLRMLDDSFWRAERKDQSDEIASQSEEEGSVGVPGHGDTPDAPSSKKMKQVSFVRSDTASSGSDRHVIFGTEDSLQELERALAEETFGSGDSVDSSEDEDDDEEDDEEEEEVKEGKDENDEGKRLGSGGRGIVEKRSSSKLQIWRSRRRSSAAKLKDDTLSPVSFHQRNSLLTTSDADCLAFIVDEITETSRD